MELQLSIVVGAKFKRTTTFRQVFSEHRARIDTVIVTGFCAEFCVLSTYRGAEDFDFKAIMLKGALASDNAEHIRFVEEISETVSFGALKTLL